jgi:hypothetical protein
MYFLNLACTIAGGNNMLPEVHAVIDDFWLLTQRNDLGFGSKEKILLV